MEEGTLELGGVRLHHLQWNSGERTRPAVLLLHGLSSNARFWERVAQRLPGRRAVALDQRAHGLSSAPVQGYLPQTLAADAAGVIERLDLGRVVVVGHSWGASIALELAADRPDLVAGLVLVDGPIRPWSERGLTWEQAASFMQPPLPAYANLAEAIAERRSLLKAAWGDDLAEFVRAGLLEDDGLLRLPMTEAIRLQILRAMFFQPYDLQWGQVACPVLIAMAESAAPFLEFKRSSAKLVMEQVPGAVVHWYRTGHDIPFEDPAGVAADIERTCLRAGLADVTAAVIDLVETSHDLNRPLPGSEPGAAGWTAKDLLSHISSSQAALPAVARTAGQPVGEARERGNGEGMKFDSTRWNAGQVGRRRNLPVTDLIAELSSSLAETDAVLAELALSAPVAVGPFAGGPAGEALRLMITHQRGHLAELEEILSPRESTPLA